MSKKRASSPTAPTPPKKPAPSKQHRANKLQDESDDDSPGEFEDEWGDEYESDDVVSGDEDELEGARDGVGEMDLDAVEEEGDEAMPYLPGLGQGSKELEEGEELVPDLSSYVLLHHARLAWPCLSFDVLRDVRRGALPSIPSCC
jgi:ribosome assembly protein RRB1